MKFNVKALIATLEQKIKDDEAAALKREAEEQAKVAAHRQEWLDKYKPDYVAFADKIREKLRKDRPILASDIPSAIKSNTYREDLRVYAPYRPEEIRRDRHGLAGILKILRAVTDEEITPAALKSLGIKDISIIF